MRFVVTVENLPGTEDARKSMHPAHLDYIAEHPEVLIAGSINPAGEPLVFEGMWIVEAPDRATVQALMEDEPFFRAGYRKAIHIYEYVPPQMFDHLFGHE